MDSLNWIVAPLKIFRMMHFSSQRRIGRMVIALVSLSVFIPGMLSRNMPSSTLSDVTYEELIQLNATCPSRDSCQANRTTEDLRYINCHCDSSCTLFETCCIDSKYKTAKMAYGASNINCNSIYGKYDMDVFMVDRCKRNWDGEDFVEDLCLGDGQAMNDPFLLIPVTSLQTGITYRNYFCSVCNEDVEASPPVFWNLKLTGRSENLTGPSIPNLIFNETVKFWTVLSDNETDEPEYVSVVVDIPEKLRTCVKTCHKDIIKYCSEQWTDDLIRAKCSAYMALVWIFSDGITKRYKNPHCAICNFEVISDKMCGELGFAFAGHVPDLNGVLFVGLFSLEDKSNRCPRNKVYDKFTGKCRVFRCGKNRTTEKGKCVSKSA